MSKAIDKLPPAHKAFVRAYVANGYNGTNAYLTIKPNVSYDSASVTANRLLSDIKIQAALDSLQVQAYEKNIASRQYLTQEAHDIGVEARQKGQYNPALTAIDLKAKLNRVYDRDTPDLEAYQTVMQQFIQVNVSSPTVQSTPDSADQAIDITPDITDNPDNSST